MNTVARQTYVISDLHIGGTYPDSQAPLEERRRGFRMMTRVAELAGFIEQLAKLPAQPEVELVINGDFVDFLAEEAKMGLGPTDPSRPPAWKAFREGREEALDTFRTVVARDKAVFRALSAFVKTGKRLTLLLGNHDVELSIPDVRAELERELGPGSFRFIDDGQALDLGDVLVEHGNLFDPANVVDHERLRVYRALYSRGWFADLTRVFPPPAGSKLVAEIMNPIKLDYGFIDLLKPESEPLFALLLALEPSYGQKLNDLSVILAGAARTLVPRRGTPFRLRNVGANESDAPSAQLRDVASVGGVDGALPPSALEALLVDTLVAPGDAAGLAALRASAVGVPVGDATQAVPPSPMAPSLTGLQDVASGRWRARGSLLRLLANGGSGELADRLQAVQATLRVLRGDLSSRRDQEEKRYLEAAAWLAEAGAATKGYRAVVFGHTHHAKDVPLEEQDARYLNSGTWANLMRFPLGLFDEDPRKVREELIAFATRLSNNDLDLDFSPTYVRIDHDPTGELLATVLCDYDWKNGRLT